MPRSRGEGRLLLLTQRGTVFHYAWCDRWPSELRRNMLGDPVVTCSCGARFWTPQRVRETLRGVVRGNSRRRVRRYVWERLRAFLERLCDRDVEDWRK